MIIVRSPLRISLGGGGTDLPSYYEKYTGYVVAGAIDKYVYVTVSKPFDQGIYLKYSKLENITKVSEVQHPIIREALLLMNMENPQIEITSLADVPSGTGLGSSGSFTTALLRALHTFSRKTLLTHDLASLACSIELDRLKEPIGKQDQFISAYGGLMEMQFLSDHKVNVNPLQISNDTLHRLEDNLMLFFTGQSRSASTILFDQNQRSLNSDVSIEENLHQIREMGVRTATLISNGNLDEYADLLNEHWEKKKVRSSSISNSFIEHAYNHGRNNGALGGKLVGAGGGGFILFYTHDKEKLRYAMLDIGLQELRFNFDFEGTKVVMS